MPAYKGSSQQWALATCLLFLAAATVTSASLIAIDLGSEFLKISLIKPGRTPISIVINEMSKRKSPALVGFVNGERLLGEEAFSFAVRYPETTIARARDLLGKPASDPTIAQMVKEHALPYEVVEHPERKGVAAVKISEELTVSAEELVASILQYAKGISQEHAGGPVLDAVLVVPAHFGQAQRQAYIDAAELAGLNVIGLINSHTAAALQYGIERDFANKTEHIVLYDMGSGSTEVSLIKYSSYTVKEGGKPKAISQLEVKDVDWDHTLGANLLDTLLAQHFAAQFAEKQKLSAADVLGNAKAMAKMKKQVRRTKEILSANSGAPMSVEELYDNKDFQSSMTREEFEALAGDFFARALAPLQRVLERSGLKPEEITGVELLGGGTRVPKLQAVLSEALQGRTLDRHLDADEAAVLGAGLFAANLSTSFRLRKFGMTDLSMYGVQMAIDEVHIAEQVAGEDGTVPPAPEKLRNLLPCMKKLPIKRVVHLANVTKSPIRFSLAYNTSTLHGLPPGVAAPELAEFEISGIEGAIERYNSSGVVSLRFEADYGGVLRFDKAEAVVDYTVIEEKIVEVKPNKTASDGNGTKTAGDKAEAGDKAKDEGAKEGDAKEGDAKDGADAESAEGEKKEDTSKDSGDADSAEGADKKEEAEAAAAEAESAAADAAAAGGNETDSGVTAGNATDAKNTTTVKTIKVERKRTAKVKLNVTGKGWLYPTLGGEALKTAQATIAAWVKAEKAKRDTAAAKNELEAYIIKKQDTLGSDELLQKVSTEEMRTAFSAELTEAEDWLYGDGEHEDAAGYRKRLAKLKETGDPMDKRAKELEMRPRLLKGARDAMAERIKAAGEWSDTKPWIAEAEAQDVIKKCEEFLEWLKGKEEEQSKKADWEDPVLTMDEASLLYEKVDKLFNKVNNKRKPRPPPEAANKTKTNETSGDSDPSDSKDGGDASKGGKESDAGSKKAEDKSKDSKDSKAKADADPKAKKEAEAKAKKDAEAKAKKEKEEKAKKEKEAKYKKEKEAKAKKEKEEKAKKDKEAKLKAEKAKKEKEEKLKKEKAANAKAKKAKDSEL